MKVKVLLAMIAAAAISANAQGYRDGIDYYKAGQYGNAITVLNKNLNKAGTNNALSYYYLGQSYLALDKKDQAVDSFKKGIAADANCAFNYIGLGAVDLLNNNLTSAKNNFAQAQKLDKKNDEVAVDIARAYFKANPTAYEKQIFDLVDKKMLKDLKNRHADAYIFAGDREASRSNWGEAATWYEQAIDADVDNPEGYVKYANVYFYIQPDYAIQKLQELLTAHPNSALAQRELAEKYYKADRWSDAAKQYGQYISNPNHFPEDKARYAVLLYAGGDYNNAARISKEVIASDPTNFQAKRVLVRSLDQLKNTDEALAAGKALLDDTQNADMLNPSDFTVVADLYKEKKDTVNMMAVVEKGLKKFPDNVDMIYTTMNALSDANRYNEAADYAGRWIKALGDDVKNSQLWTASGHYFQAVFNNWQSDEAAAKKYADQGIEIMNRLTEGRDLKDVPVQYLRRKIWLPLYAGKGEITDDIANQYTNLVSALDLDPKNADPANADNFLNYYVEAYTRLKNYYINKNDKDKVAEMDAQLSKYKALQGN